MINIESKRNYLYFSLIINFALFPPALGFMASLMTLIVLTLIVRPNEDSINLISYSSSLVSSTLTIINTLVIFVIITYQGKYIDTARNKQTEQSAEIERLERIIDARPHRTNNQPAINSENPNEQERLLIRNRTPNYQATMDVSLTTSSSK